MTDFAIPLTAIMTAVPLLIGGFTAWRIIKTQVALHEQQIDTLKKQVTTVETKVEATMARVEQIREKSASELNEFRLQVAREYATTNAIREMEERLVSAIERLGDRFDKYVDRQTSA